MAKVNADQPKKELSRLIVFDEGGVKVELVIFDLLFADGSAYGCRAFSSTWSRITSLYDNEKEARQEVASFKIAVPTDRIPAR